MADSAAAPVYHVLLIGVDAYPADYNSLQGCINDIDAVEAVLRDSQAGELRITRLVAPRHPNGDPPAPQPDLPTRANIVRALQRLAQPDVSAADRVLIYYSGHGDQKQWPGEPVWHEALVPCDVQFLYDIEVNALINAIAQRTDDLTIVLDACHSGGVRLDRADDETGADRLLKSGGAPGQPPDPARVSLAQQPGPPGPGAGGLLRSLDPPYLYLAACQANERAREQVYGGERHGVLTQALVKILRTTEPAQRLSLRWTDILPELLDNVTSANPDQHPLLTGRAERRILGGTWDRQDPGFQVVRTTSESYVVAAGRLLGVNPGAILAVYGATPTTFPPIGSAEDQAAHPQLLRVVEANRADCTATAVGTPFDLPPGARARLVQPGTANRLRVALDPADADLQTALEQSPFITIVPPGTADAEVWVRGNARDGWTITNEVESEVAGVHPGAQAAIALRAGLETYTRYNMVLSLARNSNDPQLNGCLDVRLLDCTDTAAVAALPDPRNPGLSEAPRDDMRVYAVPFGFPFCVQVSNFFSDMLYVSLLSCKAEGRVEYLGDVALHAGERQAVWTAGQLRQPFIARPPRWRNRGVDRVVAVATTCPGVDFKGLEVTTTPQQVIDAVSQRGTAIPAPGAGQSEPSVLWTGLVTPVKVGS